MNYEEFKQIEDAKRDTKMREMQFKANKYYNEGLWDAVKWNPFKWWAFVVFKKPVS